MLKPLSKISLFTLHISRSSRIGEFRGFLFSRILYSSIIFSSIPVFTRLLTPADFGLVAIVISVQVFTSLFIHLNMHSEAAVNYHRYDLNDFKLYTNSLFSLLFFNIFLVCFAILAFWMSGIYRIPFQVYWLFCIVLTSSCNFFYLFAQSYLQIKRNIRLYSLYENLYAFLPIAFSLLFILLIGQSWKSRVAGLLVGQALVGIIAYLKLFRSGFFRIFSFDKLALKSTLKFCLPLVPHTLAGISMIYAYQYIISLRLGLSDAGVYSLVMQVCLAPMILSESINKALTPWIYERMPKYSFYSNQIWKILFLVFILHIFFSLIFGVIIFLGWPFIFPPAYSISFLTLLVLSSASGLFGCYSSVSLLLFGGKKTSYLPLVTILSTLFSVALAYFYAYDFGLIGIASCTFVNYLLLFVITLFLSIRFYPLELKL